MSLNPAKPLCNGISHIPDDLVKDILHRLPVKTLLRCRCVCKPWCSSIDTTTFIKFHLQRNIERNPDSGLIFIALPERHNLYLADVNSLNDVAAVEITNPLKTRSSGADIVGSCNGLVCLLWNEDDMLLWNPATRKHRKLPTTNLCRPITSFWSFVVGSTYVVGFGYDQLNDDYKVVRIYDHTLNGVFDGVILSVYSLKSNSWTEPRTLLYPICLFGSGTFVDRCLYWLAFSSDSYVLVAFDLAVERFRELPFPAGVEVPAGVNMATENALRLRVFNGRLCLIDCYRSRTDIWLKNNDGVENSWSKLYFPMEQTVILRCLRYYAPNIRNEILLHVGDTISWYDCQKDEVEHVNLYGLPDMFDLFVYTESLVQLSYDLKLEGKQLPKQSKQKELERQMKNTVSKLICKVFKLKL